MQDAAEDFQHYVFHGLSVHKTHTMATQGILQLHFCSYCGASGKARAYHLKHACPLVPSKAGRQALNMLANDVNPGYRKEQPKGSKARFESEVPRKCSLGKLMKAKAAYKLHRSNLKAVKTAARKRSLVAPPCLPDSKRPSLSTNKPNIVPGAPMPGKPHGASSECPLCWPLGASELGFCICGDLDLVGARPSLTRQRPESAVEQCMTPHTSPGVAITFAAPSPGNPSRPSSWCARCWPLGASEIGVCICGDLALASISFPAK
jgi:hypothetical protein